MLPLPFLAECCIKFLHVAFPSSLAETLATRATDTHLEGSLSCGLRCWYRLDSALSLSAFSLDSRASLRSVRILLLIAAALSGAERTTSWVEAVPPGVLDLTEDAHGEHEPIAKTHHELC